MSPGFESQGISPGQLADSTQRGGAGGGSLGEGISNPQLRQNPREAPEMLPTDSKGRQLLGKVQVATTPGAQPTSAGS